MRWVCQPGKLRALLYRTPVCIQQENKKRFRREIKKYRGKKGKDRKDKVWKEKGLNFGIPLRTSSVR